MGAENPGGGGIQYASGASISTPTGTVTVGKYNSTPPTVTSGNVQELQLDSAGNLKTNNRYLTSSDQVTIANASLPVTGAFYQTTQPVSGTVAVSNATLAVTESGTWTVQPGNTANTTPWLASLQPATSGGWSVAFQSALSTTLVAVKSSAGQVGGWYFYNSNPQVAFIQFFNLATGSVTLGSTAPFLSIGIPATSAANIEFTNGIAFSTAISIATATTATGNAANAYAVIANVLYK